MKISKSITAFLLAFIASIFVATAQQPADYPGNYARSPRFKALLYYSETVELAHVQFGHDAIRFFKDLTVGNGFLLDVTTSLAEYPYEKLKEYDVMIVINTAPGSKAEREAFEKYMENGGGWVGFHAAGYNDKNTHWEWFNKFLGCGAFLCNNWPPQPALVELELTKHPVTKNLPKQFVAPKCEWYMWSDGPETRDNVDVLISLDPSNFPIGIKDVVSFGEYPIVWTNRDYRMIYLNIGHGDEEFTDATQNLLLINALRWIVSRDPKGDPFLVR